MGCCISQGFSCETCPVWSWRGTADKGAGASAQNQGAGVRWKALLAFPHNKKINLAIEKKFCCCVGGVGRGGLVCSREFISGVS